MAEYKNKSAEKKQSQAAAAGCSAAGHQLETYDERKDIDNLIPITFQHYKQGCGSGLELTSIRPSVKSGPGYQLRCCCCLPCNHCSNWTWVVEEILAFGTRLRSTHCREFNFLKLCRPA